MTTAIYKGYSISEEFVAMSKPAAFRVRKLHANGASGLLLLGLYSSADEARAWIDSEIEICAGLRRARSHRSRAVPISGPRGITVAERIKAAGFSHIVTYGGPVPVDDWRPYDKSPEEVACTFSLDGDTLRESPKDPAGSIVSGLLVTGVWRLVRLATLAALLSLPAFAAEPCRINVNTATAQQLQLFSRTGPVLAGKLASGRPYKALKDVDAVKGIGPAWLAINGPHVAFSGATTCKAEIPTPKAPKVPPVSPLP